MDLALPSGRTDGPLSDGGHSGNHEGCQRMDELQVIEAEVRSCPRCRLSQTRKHAVPGEGPPNARIMLVGEGPGYWENEEGRPFVGRAGKLLEELLAGIGLGRQDVYITNVV